MHKQKRFTAEQGKLAEKNSHEKAQKEKGFPAEIAKVAKKHKRNPKKI